jgi:KTSC domain
MEMREVYSSAVDRIGYDEGTEELHVRWKRSGRLSIYEGVPAKLADEVMNAPSVGKAVMSSIQPFCGHRYG